MATGTLDGSATPYVIASGSVITEQAGDALLLLGSIANAGTIALAATGADAPGPPSTTTLAALVVASPTVTLGATGVVSLVDMGIDVIYGGIPGTTLVNAGNTIEGAGNIGIPQTAAFANGGTAYPFTFINAAGGVVDGIGTGITALPGGGFSFFNELVLSAATLDNAGLLEGTGQGGLVISADTFDNAGGTILALGTGNGVGVQADVNGGLIEAASGGVVDLVGSFMAVGTSGVNVPPVLAGVTLQTTTGGTITTPYGATATLDGRASPVTITAGSTVTDGGTLALTGTIDDLGTILVAGVLGLEGSIDLLGTLIAVGSTEVVSGTTYTLPVNVELLSPGVTLGGGGLWALGGAVVEAPTGATGTLVVAGATIVGSGALGYTPNALQSGTPIGLDNQAGGVIDASGTSIYTATLQIYGGGNTDLNAGLIETTGAGGLTIQTATLDNTGGTLLADVGTIDFTSTELFGGTLRSANGGGFLFSGTNTLGPTGPGPGGTGAGLTFNGSTVQVAGAVPFGGTLDLLGPSLTLYGNDTFDLGLGNFYPNVLDAASGVSVVNYNDRIFGGQIGDGSTTWSLTNAAGGIISDTTIALPGGLTNAGLLEADTNGALVLDSVINNAGGTILATGGLGTGTGTVDITGGDIIGGTLATSNGGLIVLSGSVVLDGTAAPLTIAAGTTVQAYTTAYSAPFSFNVGATLDMTGTIHSLGTLAEPFDPGGGIVPSGVTTNHGLYYGSGAITNAIVNDGTILAQGGTLSLGTVTGSGSLAIDPGSTLLVDQSTETVNFQGQAGGVLAVQTGNALTPNGAFTGGLANLVVGDTIDLIGLSLQSAAPIDGGSTLAVSLAGGTTLDYGLSNLAPGASFLVAPAFAAPTESYTFSYTDNAGDSGTGSFSAIIVNGTADLADLKAFSFTLDSPNPAPEQVLPIRIAAHAFGPGLPTRALSLSPDHAVFVDGVLIPVKYLVDGHAITRRAAARVTYYHVELPRHDLLLAEGLATESYLDCGDRGLFAGAGDVITLHPDFATRAREAAGCAPLIVSGPALDAARAGLAARRGSRSPARAAK